VPERPRGSPPRVSVFTAAYAAGDGIDVPARSVLVQSEEDWEWVIVESSGAAASIEVIRRLMEAPEARGRIRLEAGPPTTSIGAAKRRAADLCRADVLVELDHDDELRPEALATVLAAFDTHPEVGFLYSDWIDVIVGDDIEPEAGVLYPPGWGFGYGAHASEEIDGVRVPVALAPPLTWETVRHIVAAPNHLRAWRPEAYRRAGGHDPEMAVGDDFDLVVRTFLTSGTGHITRPLYVQRHDRAGGSASRVRNAEIQVQVAASAEHHRADLDERCLELGVIPSPEHPLTGPEPIAAASLRIDPDSELRSAAGSPLVSVVTPTYNRPDELHRALESVLSQTYADLELLVVGDDCPTVDEVVAGISDPRLRHRNLTSRYADGGTSPRNFALKAMARGELIAYLDDDNSWDPGHLESLVDLLADPAVAYAFSSIEIAGEMIDCAAPRLYLLDTSALLHRRSLLDRYGFWRSPAEIGHPAHDWELVSAWTDEGWAASRRATLHYSLDPGRHDPRLVATMREAAAAAASEV
jgi:glycosyltransferase involved in cell wall biosynthesis